MTSISALRFGVTNYTQPPTKRTDAEKAAMLQLAAGAMSNRQYADYPIRLVANAEYVLEQLKTKGYFA